jgi:hypothetical protein
MPFDRNQFRGETPDREQLLAVLEVRRCVEPGAAVEFVFALVAKMKTGVATVASLVATVTELNELIVAIDRRLPQVQRAGEAAIANAAVRLRTEAEKRIKELEGEIAGRRSMERRPTAS